MCIVNVKRVLTYVELCILGVSNDHKFIFPQITSVNGVVTQNNTALGYTYNKADRSGATRYIPSKSIFKTFMILISKQQTDIF